MPWISAARDSGRCQVALGVSPLPVKASATDRSGLRCAAHSLPARSGRSAPSVGAGVPRAYPRPAGSVPFSMPIDTCVIETSLVTRAGRGCRCIRARYLGGNPVQFRASLLHYTVVQQHKCLLD